MTEPAGSAAGNRFAACLQLFIAVHLKGFIYDYPAHEWLLRYWYEHCDEMDIEYDAVYSDGTMTEEKYALLTELHPEFRLENLNREPERSPEEIIHDMIEAVGEYIEGMEPFDDLTMMSFAYYGPERLPDRN